MYKAILLIIAITFSANFAAAQSISAEVGKTPVYISYDKSQSLYHVFCYGYDANFDGNVDDGDEVSSWWTVVYDGASLTAEKKMDFERFFGTFNLKPAYDAVTSTFFVPFGNKTIAALDAKNFEIKSSEFITGKDVNAIATTPGGSHLFMSVLPEVATDNGSVQVFAVSSQSVIQTIPVGIRPAEIFNYPGKEGKQGFAVMNEGFFGQNNSTLVIGEFSHMQDPETITIDLGDTGNHAFMDGEDIIITMNGSDELVIVDRNSREISHRIDTETSSGNGPRQGVVIGNSIYVSTFDGNVKAYDRTTYELTNTIDLENKADAIAAGDGNLLVAMPYVGQSFEVNNEVVLLGNLTSVAEMQTKELSVYPNPSSGTFFVESEIGDIIRLIDQSGRIYYEATTEGGMQSIENIELSNGIYFIEVIGDNARKFSKVIISK